MNKIKKSVEVERPKKKGPKVGSLALPNNTRNAEEVLTTKDLTTLWQNEIKGIMEARPTSVEEAVKLVVQSVMQKLRMEGDAELADFLTVLLESDGVIQEELQRIVEAAR